MTDTALRSYTLRDEAGTEKVISAASMDDAEVQAKEWVRDGDYGQIEKTIWIDAEIFTNDDSERSFVTVAIDPVVPPCKSGETHNWQSPYRLVGGLRENPGVFGNGGGVIITEACVVCGCRRTTDTWAQNPTTGKQGLTSVEYAEGVYVTAEDGRSEEHVDECTDTECVDGCPTQADRDREYAAGHEWHLTKEKRS